MGTKPKRRCCETPVLLTAKSYVPINSKLQHPPPGRPWEFDSKFFPGVGIHDFSSENTCSFFRCHVTQNVNIADIRIVIL